MAGCDLMVSVAPPGAIDIDITGDSTGFVTGEPPNDATGDLDETVTFNNPGWSLWFTTWSISDDPGIGTATIDGTTGEWTYVVDPAEFDALDNGEIVSDTFEVTLTAFAFPPGGGINNQTETLLVTVTVEGVCFCAGTLIETPLGAIAVQNLNVKDMVTTVDHGPQPIRWIESSTVSAQDLNENAALRPVRIAAGALGAGVPQRDLYVSQQHRILMAGPAVELLFGEAEVLVPAKSLTNWPGIEIVASATPVEYFHILLDRHEVLLAEGAKAESLYLGEEALSVMGSEGLQELATIFADTPGSMPTGFGAAARKMLKDFEAVMLQPV